jgi:hypothetical protein
MNIPNVYRKALDGFIVQPRTFTQMLSSAFMGAFSLLNEKNRSNFIEQLDKGVINEAVVSQATSGPLMMLSLFHDMQSPLFKRYDFDPKQFLDGVAPALENFHSVSGTLENKFHKIQAGEQTTTTKGDEEAHSDDNDLPVSGEEKESIFRMYKTELSSSKMDENQVVAVLNHEWMDDAKKDPESLAGQLSRMLTGELFQLHQIGAKTAFLLQNHKRSILFEEGSCRVNNVALLSARSFLRVPNEANETTEKQSFQAVDYNIDEGELDEKAGVVAQFEVLYDVTQNFVAENYPDSEEKETDKESEQQAEGEPMSTTIVSVAVIEGWLNGGPDGQLRWKISLHRPAIEFPGIQQAY